MKRKEGGSERASELISCRVARRESLGAMREAGGKRQEARGKRHEEEEDDDDDDSRKSHVKSIQI